MSRSVKVDLGTPGALEGDLVVPADAAGLVVFAHGSGSSRRSPRNRSVAAHLQRAGLATLLTDLLTPDEEQLDRRTAQHRFDIDLLARRLERILDCTARQPDLVDLPLGLFGASTGAGAALVAAARSGRVVAVVSRGGRPDLADRHLASVTAPTLLIVGSRDPQVLELNRSAAGQLAGEVQLEIVEGATHLFEEPGALDRVSDLAARWFTCHLTATRATP